MADVNISKYRASVVRDGSKPASPGFVVSEGQDPVNPPGTNNFVPYTGATANVELGEFGVEAGFVTLDTTPTNIPTDQGTIYWDDTRSTAALIMNGTLQHIGQDSFFYVKNSSGSTIPKGTCVGFAGTDGGSGHLLVTPFLANGSVPSTYFMGVTCESIANGSFGQVMHFGELEGINTSGFTAGALLYASSTVAGAFQTTPPVAPNNIILVAAAVNSKNNGAIVVRPTLGSNFGTNESVKLTSVANLDLLQYQSGTGVWENKTLAQVIGSAYVPSTRTLTINGTALDLSVDRSWSVGDMLLNTYQVVTGTKVFGTNRLIMEGEGTAQPTSLSNTQTSNSALASHNSFGFNGSNNIYFNKGTTANGGIFAFSNTATRTYTLKDASGTLAFVSDIPSLSGYVQGSGTTNYVSKFTGSGTIGNSQIFDNGTNVGIGTASPASLLHVSASYTAPTGGIDANVQLLTSNTSGASVINMLASNSSVSAIHFGDTDDANVGEIAYTHSNNNMLFVTNAGIRMRLDASGNLGLGVTPSAWDTNVNVKALQMNAGSIWGFSTVAFLMVQNSFSNTSGIRTYVNNGFASEYEQASGQHIWKTAPSGTAGNAISFTQAMTLTSGGNLLVGTTSDNGARLQVSGRAYINNVGGSVAGTTIYGNDQSNVRLRLENVNGRTWELTGGLTGANNSDFTIYDVTASATRMVINSSGSVGIGTSSPSGRLTVSSDQSSNNQHINILGTQSGFSQEYTIGIPTSTKDLRIYDLTANVERMRITSGGALLINGQTQGEGALQIFFNDAAGTPLNYGARIVAGRTNSSVSIGFGNPNGLVGSIQTSGSSTSYNTSSDYRLKTDLKDYNGLDLVNKIKTYDFAWKTDNTRSFGVIAHELQDVINYAVTGQKDGQIMQGVDYSKLVPIMVKAIQELKQEIDTLKN